MSDKTPESITAPAWVPRLEPHPDDETIELYVRGKLGEDRTNELEDHYALCRHCQRRIVESQDLMSTVRAALTQVPYVEERLVRRPFLSRLWNWLRGSAPIWVPALAALILGVGLTWMVAPGFFHSKPVEVVLAARRGVEFGSAPADRLLTIKLDRTGLPVVRSGTLVSNDGRVLQHQSWKVDDPVWLSVTAGLPAGRYWVRLYEQANPQADSPPLREFGLEVH